MRLIYRLLQQVFKTELSIFVSLNPTWKPLSLMLYARYLASKTELTTLH